MVSGTRCEVTCDDGYELSGYSNSVCGIDGEWDPRTTANCKGKRQIHSYVINLLSDDIISKKICQDDT